jgi:hypothetical protein
MVEGRGSVSAAAHCPPHNLGGALSESHVKRLVFVWRHKHGVTYQPLFVNFHFVFCPSPSQVSLPFSLQSSPLHMVASHSKAPPAGHASKPPAASRTKNNTAPRNINLDDDEENILPQWTRNERPRSSKQAQLGYLSPICTNSLLIVVSDAEAMEKQMASMVKQLKAYKKVQWQREKSLSLLSLLSCSHCVVFADAGASNKSTFDDEEECESEEEDSPSGNGFFAQSVMVPIIQLHINF